MQVTDKIEITNEDNMELMARYPDNYFDLAIVDPPYGINRDGHFQKTNHRKNYTKKGWDNETPKIEYWNELFRISKNQIVWGANYFSEFLPSSMGWIVWDKGQRDLTMSDGELAFTSFNKRLVIKEIFRVKIGENGGYLHPTQKPVCLYKWLLDKYAKDGDKILDTHLGSGSIAIACHDYGFDLTACELDLEYYEKAIQRIKNHTSQQKLF
jgi:site-specific DNA-methyltransferase (adenine-specific)